MTTMLSTRSAPRRFLPPTQATHGQRRLLLAVIILLVAHVAATALFVLGG